MVANAPEAIASGPYTERLTRAGKPVAWDDPAIVDDPDLRMVAFFVTATANRGKKLVVLVGQKKAVGIAVRNVSGRRRWSKLKEWLGAASAMAPVAAQ